MFFAAASMFAAAGAAAAANVLQLALLALRVEQQVRLELKV